MNWVLSIYNSRMWRFCNSLWGGGLGVGVWGEEIVGEGEQRRRVWRGVGGSGREERRKNVGGGERRETNVCSFSVGWLKMFCYMW